MTPSTPPGDWEAFARVRSALGASSQERRGLAALQEIEVALLRFREREAQGRKELGDALYEMRERAEAAEARVKELEFEVSAIESWKRREQTLEGDLATAEARVDELEEQLQDCYDDGEHAAGERQDRILELEAALLRAREAPGGPQDRRVRELEEAIQRYVNARERGEQGHVADLRRALAHEEEA